MANNNNQRIEVVSIIFIVLVISGFIVWISRDYFLKEQTAAEKAKTIPISEFSLNGEIISLSDDGFEIRTGWVEETKAGKKFVIYDKKIEIDSDTKFYSNINFSLSEIENNEELLDVGSKIIVYGPDYPYNLEVFKATRVDLLQ